VRLGFTPRNRTFGLLDALGVTGLVGLTIARFIPVARLPFWSCQFRRLTGWPCPGCGLTRAADRLAHLHFAGALLANPLGTLVGFFFVLTTVYMVVHLLVGLPTPEIELSQPEGRRVRIGLAAALLTNYAFVIVQTRVFHLG
jgi:hypothetical protein